MSGCRGIRWTVAIVGLGLGLSSQAHAQAATDRVAAARPAAPANLPAAIAELLAPRDLVLAKAVQGFDRQFDAQLAAAPASATMEQRYPGITAAIKAEAGQQVVKAMSAELPGLAVRTAGIFADDFDLVEQRQVYDFLISPAGRRLVAAGDKIYDQAKLRQRSEKAERDGKGGKLTGADLAAAVDPAALDGFTAADVTALQTFTAQPGGAKFVAATPKLQQVMADWLNRLTTAHEAEMEAAIAARARAFIAQSGTKH